MRAHASLVLLALTTILPTGCVMTRPSTRVRVRDPGRISIASGWSTADEAQVIVLPAASPAPAPTSADAVVARGAFHTGKTSSASYETHAIREEDGSITLRWAGVPMPAGDREPLVGRDGTIEVRGLDADQVISSEGLGRAQMRLRSAGWLTTLSDEEDTPIGFKGHVGLAQVPSDSALTVPFTLATPWSNVVEIRRLARPARGTAALMALLSTVLFGAIGVPLALSSPKVVAVTGDALLGVGATIDLLLLPTIFAPDSDERVYPK